MVSFEQIMKCVEAKETALLQEVVKRANDKLAELDKTSDELNANSKHITSVNYILYALQLLSYLIYVHCDIKSIKVDVIQQYLSKRWKIMSWIKEKKV